MTIKYKTAPDGSQYMDIQELRDLDASHDNFRKNRSDTVAQTIFFNHLVSFLDFCINYANDIFKGKSYSFDHVIPQLFITKIKSQGQYKQYLRYALYAAKLYAEKLRNDIEIDYIDNLDELTYTLSSDYEWLIASYETEVLNHSNIRVHHGSRRGLNVMDIKWGANQLMFAEFTKSLRYYDYRNTKPYVIFMVRQCLEILGKNMIGFASINDKNGKAIHQFTQVSWAFLSEVEKAGKQLIDLPIKASSIQQLNAWTNSFVHTSYFYSCYTQYYALEALYAFSKPAVSYVQTYNGKHQSTLYGDFRIKNYAELRSEFEKYVTSQHGGYPVYIEWLDLKDVGAYILSLGNNTEEKKGCLLSILSALVHRKQS